MFAESLTIWRSFASRRGIAASLESCAALATSYGPARDRPPSGRRSGGATRKHRNSPSNLEKSRLVPWLNDARRGIGAEAARVALKAGEIQGLDTAIDEAFDVITAAMTVPPTEGPIAKAANSG